MFVFFFKQKTEYEMRISDLSSDVCSSDLVLARRDANIKSLDDLKGKRVNIGNPGSGQRDTLEEIMKEKGWDQSVFSLAAELKPAELADRKSTRLNTSH